jgi:hypothetical protein
MDLLATHRKTFVRPGRLAQEFRTRPKSKSGIRLLAAFAGAIALLIATAQPAAAADFYYKNSTSSVGTWYHDPSVNSYANTALPQASASAVAVSNGVFTASAQGYVHQSYAYGDNYSPKCKWTTPPGVTWKQNLKCWDSY